MNRLAEIAKLAGVSAATVSRTLNRPELVAERTRVRVMNAVQATGFRPNELARSLRQQGSRSIGLVVTDLNPFHATLVKAVQDTAEQNDLNVILFTSDDSESREREALLTLRSHMPQGLILIPTAHTRQHQKLLQGLTVVELDRESGLTGTHTVQAQNRQGALEAVRHLTALGHRNIGAIFGQLHISTARARFEGYVQALQEAGIAYDETLVRYGNDLEASGRAAALSLLAEAARRPTALFVSNHEMTVGAIIALRSLNLKIPRDLSLASFDDSRLMLLHEPPISVVAQPTYELGKRACEVLVRALEGGEPQHLRLEAPFIPRGSTAPP
ncbi:LacI family transcriptional regulator [Deinococcus detaillensis]|uniref:LacI family transcriptional regulator n=1 Tax=Deinococcus detaillensis TaxID=2592048 RepID=A0A553UNM5_9DEIO|nr:LacI family DNA-binding transcriptional regulator [Deinococcus detaillensis]TSA81810.1 LacI family transcriptional regulator [Deinococcus detaillensis]